MSTTCISSREHSLLFGRDLEVHNEPDTSDYFEGEENLLSLKEMKEMSLNEEDNDLTVGYNYDHDYNYNTEQGEEKHTYSDVVDKWDE